MSASLWTLMFQMLFVTALKVQTARLVRLAEDTDEVTPTVSEPKPRATMDDSPTVMVSPITEVSRTFMHPPITVDSPTVKVPAITDDSSKVTRPSINNDFLKVTIPPITNVSSKVTRPSIMDDSPKDMGPPPTTDVSSKVTSPTIMDDFPKITKWSGLHPHFFIFHGRDCNSYTDPGKKIQLGCVLKDFRTERGASLASLERWHEQKEKPWDYVGQPREVHWNLEDWQKGLDYTRRARQHIENVSWLAQEFRMPDFCSRAIISELSTVYSRGRRTRSANAETSGRDCSKWTPEEKSAKEQQVFNPRVEGRSDWNFVADYRRVYCIGYQQCATCDKPSDEDCHFNAEKIRCCEDAYDRRIEGRSLPDFIGTPPP